MPKRQDAANQLLIETIKLAKERNISELLLSDIRQILLEDAKDRPYHTEIRTYLKKRSCWNQAALDSLVGNPKTFDSKVTQHLRRLCKHNYLHRSRSGASPYYKYSVGRRIEEYQQVSDKKQRDHSQRRLRIATPHSSYLGIPTSEPGVWFSGRGLDAKTDTILAALARNIATTISNYLGDWEELFCSLHPEELSKLDEEVNSRLTAIGSSAVYLYETDILYGRDLVAYKELEIRRVSKAISSADYSAAAQDIFSKWSYVAYYGYVRQKAETLKQTSQRDRDLLTKVREFIPPLPLLTADMKQIHASSPDRYVAPLTLIHIERLPRFELSYFPNGAAGIPAAEGRIIDTSKLTPSDWLDIYDCLFMEPKSPASAREMQDRVLRGALLLVPAKLLLHSQSGRPR